MKIRHAHGAENEHQLYEAILTLKNVQEAKQFFEDLCTPTERQAMADRWLVVGYIKEGKKSYRAIYDETKVSVTTVGRVARCLSPLGAGGYNLAYERILRKKQKNK